MSMSCRVPLNANWLQVIALASPVNVRPEEALAARLRQGIRLNVRVLARPATGLLWPSNLMLSEAIENPQIDNSSIIVKLTDVPLSCLRRFNTRINWLRD